jgi:hypothetical protein
MQFFIQIYIYRKTSLFLSLLLDLGSRISKYLRPDDTLVKLSKWGEGYLISLPCAVRFIEKVYEIGINKHSDTWIRDNLKVITLSSIKYSLVISPNAGNIYNSPPGSALYFYF